VSTCSPRGLAAGTFRTMLSAFRHDSPPELHRPLHNTPANHPISQWLHASRLIGALLSYRYRHDDCL